MYKQSKVEKLIYSNTDQAKNEHIHYYCTSSDLGGCAILATLTSWRQPRTHASVLGTPFDLILSPGGTIEDIAVGSGVLLWVGAVGQSAQAGTVQVGREYPRGCLYPKGVVHGSGALSCKQVPAIDLVHPAGVVDGDSEPGICGGVSQSKGQWRGRKVVVTRQNRAVLPLS